MTVIGKRRVRYNNLTVNISDTVCYTHKRGFNFGVTTKFVTDLWEPEITLYLGHHRNEAHLISTFLHEMGHAITFERMADDHELIWYHSTSHLMALIKSVYLNTNVKGLDQYEFCARQHGVNLIKK